MDFTEPLITGVLLSLFTTILAVLGKARFDALERRLDQLSTEMAQLRSDLLQVALAARPQAG